jgi:hypothetical protein
MKCWGGSGDCFVTVIMFMILKIKLIARIYCCADIAA